MALKVTREQLEDCQLALTIEVGQDRIDRELRKAARKAGREYNIPGFRRGKAPYQVIVQRVGIGALYQEFLDDLGQEVFQQALEQEEIEPYATAALEDVEIDPVRYRVIVPMEPKVDLGDYRSLRVEEEEIEISDEAVEERLEQYREQHASWKDVDRPSEYGDTLTLNVHSVLIPEDEAEDSSEDEAEETIVMSESEWDITLDEENPQPIPGLDDALLGLQTGEKKESILSWPEEQQSIYAGRSARFEIEVLKIRAFENAELTDELAQMIGPEFETVEDLVASVRETLQEEEEARAEAEYGQRVIEKAVAASTLVYPPAVVEDQINAMLNEFEQQIRQAGLESLDAFFESTGRDRDGFREEQREAATQLAEQNLVISELINAEGIVATDEDVEEQIQAMLGELNEDSSPEMHNTAEMFRDGSGRPIIESQILRTKAIERLIAIARGDELPEPTPLSAIEETAEGESSEADAVVEGHADEEIATNSSGWFRIRFTLLIHRQKSI
ncbi:trigger factor [Chloroflexi bacterium TSY]|nr:trigger factor [Chloroflexi bacterium TSY]